LVACTWAVVFPVPVVALEVLRHDHPGEIATHLHPRMDALDVGRAKPDRLHAGEVQALEGAIEGGVRFEHGGAVVHGRALRRAWGP
jgi:hypothetical protein